MELRELALRALLSPHLDDKLETPEALTDASPGPAWAAPPSAPARPRGLRLDDPRPRARFPRPGALHQAEARGRALHFFANHELLAIELMALCLLRFPEAPASFRMGVARTLLEEQDHLRRYQARMHELGVELGDVPVGDHFWRALAPMRRPLDYVTGMSLVFEQANLDHAARWMRHFSAAGDARTAELLAGVLEDEIGHVLHGVTWFERWRPPGEPFSVFARELPGGLDPVRARGPELEVEARLAAGLSPEFVRALARHRAPKGRRPRVWIFTPEVEDELAGAGPPSEAVRGLVADLAPVFGLLGSDDDLAWTPRSPSPEHDARLAQVGLPTPRRISTLAEARDHRPEELRPWGLSPGVRERLGEAEGACRVSLPELNDRALLSKALALGPRRALAERGLLDDARVGELVESPEAAERALRALEGPAILKALHSASGRHRRRTSGPLSDADRRWISRALRAQGGLLVEPWLDRQVDLGVVLPASGGRPTLLRFFTSPSGAYLGHVLGPAVTGLGAEARAALAAFPGGVPGLVEAVAAEVRRVVPEGPVGVDMLIERRPSGALAVQPVVEVNARFTMGHVAAALARRIAPGRVGLWLHVHRRVLARAGFESFSALGAELERAPMTTREEGRRLRLERGTLATNDPRSASAVLSVLAVDESLEGAAALLPSAILPGALRAR